MVYLIGFEARNGTYFKVGYTTNLEKRMYTYKGYIPNIKLYDTIKTYNKTKRNLEKNVHNELIKYYQFVNNTEWIFVPTKYEKEFAKNGLAQFKSCTKRIITKHSQV